MRKCHKRTHNAGIRNSSDILTKSNMHNHNVYKQEKGKISVEGEKVK